MNSERDFMNTKKTKIAFTLAEVLIALTIIGVVAAMTIPILLKTTEDREHITAWKKNYSVLIQVFKQIYARENDSYSLSDYPTSASMGTYFCKVQNNLKILKSGLDCTDEKNPTSSGDTVWGSRFWRLKDGTNMTNKLDAAYSDYSIKLNDGAIIQFDCNNLFWVDVNGDKGPNTVGRDIYYLFINHDNSGVPKTYFWGTVNSCSSPSVAISESNFKSDCDNSSGRGFGCSAKTILEDIK